MDSRGIFKGVDVRFKAVQKIKNVFARRINYQGQRLPYQVREPQMNMTEDWSLLLDWGTDYQDNYYQIEVPL